MRICAHCNRLSLKNIKVRWSCAVIPATCSLCGKLSHVMDSTSSRIVVLTLLLAVAGFFSAF